MGEDFLEELGLTKNEAKVYHNLIEEGISLASEIAKKTNLHRRPTYDSLNRLIKKGLIAYTIKNNRKFFRAQNPKKLQETLKEKEKTLERELPTLIEKFNETKENTLSEIYEGKEGLKSILNLILKEKKIWHSIGSSGKGPQTLHFFLDSYHLKRKKEKIKFRGLFVKNTEGIKRAKQLKKIGLAECSFLPKEIAQPQTIWIFGNYTAIILVSEQTPIITLIQSGKMAKSFQDYFNLLWKIAKSPKLKT